MAFEFDPTPKLNNFRRRASPSRQTGHPRRQVMQRGFPKLFCYNGWFVINSRLAFQPLLKTPHGFEGLE
jgi:hypothetical protein